MTTDVKFGMVVGLGVVIAVAVTYFPKNAAAPAGRAGSVMPSLPALYRGEIQSPPVAPRTPDRRGQRG